MLKMNKMTDAFWWILDEYLMESYGFWWNLIDFWWNPMKSYRYLMESYRLFDEILYFRWNPIGIWWILMKSWRLFDWFWWNPIYFDGILKVIWLIPMKSYRFWWNLKDYLMKFYIFWWNLKDNLMKSNEILYIFDGILKIIRWNPMKPYEILWNPIYFDGILKIIWWNPIYFDVGIVHVPMQTSRKEIFCSPDMPRGIPPIRKKNIHSQKMRPGARYVRTVLAISRPSPFEVLRKPRCLTRGVPSSANFKSLVGRLESYWLWQDEKMTADQWNPHFLLKPNVNDFIGQWVHDQNMRTNEISGWNFSFCTFSIPPFVSIK